MTIKIFFDVANKTFKLKLKKYKFQIYNNTSSDMIHTKALRHQAIKRWTIPRVLDEVILCINYNILEINWRISKIQLENHK